MNEAIGMFYYLLEVTNIHVHVSNIMQYIVCIHVHVVISCKCVTLLT